MIKLKLFAIAFVLLLMGGCASPAIENGTVTITPPTTDNNPASGVSVSPTGSPLPDSPAPTTSSGSQNGPSTTPGARPEVKDFTIELEGTKETMALTKYTGTNFSIYYDASKFTVKNDKAEETGFYLTNPDPNIYPDVSMSVSFEKGATAQTQAEKLQSASAGSKLPYKLDSDEKVGDLTARHLHASSGTKWNSPTSDVYFIDGRDGCYTVTISCYLEASEGWGARLGAMVKTFEVL